jgi:hypothetical protein
MIIIAKKATYYIDRVTDRHGQSQYEEWILPTTVKFHVESDIPTTKNHILRISDDNYMPKKKDNAVKNRLLLFFDVK